MKRPPLIVSCDWSADPRKRWQTVAHLSADGSYEITAPKPVLDLPDFFRGLRDTSPHGSILAGFDFPIGIPRRYADLAKVSEFVRLLPELGTGRWVDFYRVAETSSEISLTRPFYPRKPGGTNKQHLVGGLGVSSLGDLLRACDRSTSTRRQACEIFWTLGANQVGRAAISGWRDLLAPAVLDRNISIWPFEGELSELFEADRIAVAEIYPAETYSHLGLLRNFGKRSREGRRSQSTTIQGWCDRARILVSLEYRRLDFGNVRYEGPCSSETNSPKPGGTHQP